ncbi:MAG: sulfatase [Bacteroidota bacterium]|nr:sulfatase [Bacteroidota bacterium]
MNKVILRIAIFSLLFAFCACKDINDPEKPNILLINVDDLGWRDVGFMGSEFYETPVIDKLAAGGMIFTQAYASASNCAPSRACMMSGQWTPRHGIYTVGSSERGNSRDRKLIPVKNTTVLADSCYTLAEALHDAGYITCHAGKWHLNEDPLSQGFDFNIGGCEAGNPGSYYPPYRNVPLEAPSEDYYLTNLIMDKVLEFVENTDNQPFFFYYSPYAVHTPIQPVEEFIGTYRDKKEWNGQNNIEYATMIENLDNQIGRLITLLEDKGKLANTFIIFTSDNGGVYRITKQWPLRAGKGSYYEGGIREPMFIYWEGNVKAGTKNETPVTNLDFYPTILEVVCISIPEGKILDGKSLLPLIEGSGSFDDRPLFWHFPVYLERGNEETQDTLFRTRPGSAVRLGDWKLIEYFENGDLELYNIKKDIAESINLAASEPTKLKELGDILKRWRQDVDAPVPDQLNINFNKE